MQCPKPFEATKQLLSFDFEENIQLGRDRLQQNRFKYQNLEKNTKRKDEIGDMLLIRAPCNNSVTSNQNDTRYELQYRTLERATTN